MLELTAAQRLALIDRRTSKGYNRGDSEFMLDLILDHFLEERRAHDEEADDDE